MNVVQYGKRIGRIGDRFVQMNSLDGGVMETRSV